MGTGEDAGGPDAGALPEDTRGDLALVLTGGGARAAYQVGFLHTVAERCPDLRPDILTGVSAGAINATFLASHPGGFGAAIADLDRLWRELSIEDVFDTRVRSLGRLALSWGLRLISGGGLRLNPARGFLDTEPLRRFLHRTLASADGTLPGIDRALDEGRLKAFALTATSYSTGQSVTFHNGRGIADWERPNRRGARTSPTIEHVLASSALPILFPAVRLVDGWYGDGGVRLTAPLAPAVHLGARRILAISTRFGRSRAEADLPVVDGYPPPAQVASVLLNAVFLDQLDGDALRLERINQLLAKLPPEEHGALRPLRLLVRRPSRDLGKLANEYEARLPRALRFLSRGTGTLETRSNDFLSLIMFQSDYLSRLVELGRTDAETEFGEIEDFLRC